MSRAYSVGYISRLVILHAVSITHQLHYLLHLSDAYPALKGALLTSKQSFMVDGTEGNVRKQVIVLGTRVYKTNL